MNIPWPQNRSYLDTWSPRVGLIEGLRPLLLGSQGPRSKPPEECRDYIEDILRFVPSIYQETNFVAILCKRLMKKLFVLQKK